MTFTDPHSVQGSVPNGKLFTISTSYFFSYKGSISMKMLRTPNPLTHCKYLGSL